MINLLLRILQWKVNPQYPTHVTNPLHKYSFHRTILVQFVLQISSDDDSNTNQEPSALPILNKNTPGTAVAQAAVTERWP